MARTTRSTKRKQKAAESSHPTRRRHDRSSSIASLLPFRGVQHHADKNKKLVSVHAPSSSWSTDERNALYLLKKLFNLKIPECVTVLNLLFPERMCRFRIQMVRSQWYEATMRRSTWWRQHMHAMETLTDAGLRKLYKDHVAIIEATAASASIELYKAFDLEAPQSRPSHNEMKLTASRQHQMGTIDDPDNSSTTGDETMDADSPEATDANDVLSRFASLTPFIDSRLADVDLHNSLDTTSFVPSKTPQLLYRFYSTESAGLNSSKGIRASRFAMLNKYPVLGTPSVHELLWDTSIHLSRCIIPTSLISTSNQLVWVLHKLCKSNSEGKRIAIIDGEVAQNHTAIYHSARLIKELKARDMFQPSHVRTSANGNEIVNTCKYTGKLEYFVYGEVSRRSIIHTVSFEDLRHLIAQSTSVRKFFRLKQFMEATNLRALNIALSSRKLSLDRNIGIALARLAHLFGLNYRYGVDMMMKFICQMLRGWCIKITNQLDRIKAIAHTFARVLSSALDAAHQRESSELLSGAFETACQSCMKS